MFIAALFINSQEVKTQISIICQYINKHEILFNHKRNEVPIYATTWMSVENIMLSERSQTQKDTYYLTPLTENVLNGQMNRNRK